MHYECLRALLFRLSPEQAHATVLQWLNLQSKVFHYPMPKTTEHVRVMGIDFPSRCGLAAGFDKNGDYIAGLASLGFGFLELGTVTPRSQPGQPLPRIFRLPTDHALINRMGFPNKGVDHLVRQVAQLRRRPVLGINIGKNADTALEDAVHDYLHCFKRVYPYADYIAVNLSSPNTPGLRALQGGRYLPGLLSALKQEQARLSEETQRYVPLAVKIAPDLMPQELDEIAEMLLEAKIEGVIATNTTVSREGIQDATLGQQPGGLSGAPLFWRATDTLKRLKRLVASRIAVIGVGGIMSADDAQVKFNAGADLVQLYTGLIYKGPDLIQDITRLEHCAREGSLGV